MPVDLRESVIYAYRQAIAPCFLFGMALGLAACCFTVIIKNGTTHAEGPAKPAGGAPADVEKGPEPVEESKP